MRIVAAVYRSPYIAAAVLDGAEIVEVRRVRIRGRNLARGRAVLEELVREHGVHEIVLEPRALETFGRGLFGNIANMSLEEAKATLLPEDVPPTHEELLDYLVNLRPALRRLVTMLPVTRRVSRTRREGHVILFAIALGLAHARVAARYDHVSPDVVSRQL